MLKPRARKVKILATLGPASSSPEMIRSLAEAGADAFRINMSHGSQAEKAKLVEAIRALEKTLHRPSTILFDLQGHIVAKSQVQREAYFSDHPGWALEARYLALALVNFICTLSPERIVIGGGVMSREHLHPLVRRQVLELLNNYVRAPRIDTSSSKGLEMAASAASMARFSPVASPVPIIALPISLMMARTSAKSRLMRPSLVMSSVMLATPE